MRSFSRWMPPAPPPSASAPAWVGRLILAAALAAATWIFLHHPWVLAVAVGGLLVLLAFDRRHKQRLQQVALSRRGESLCTFVRAFPRGQRDPWVLRAVWEEVQPYCRFEGGTLPLRPADGLHEFLQLDDEDLDDMVLAIAQRTGRDLARWCPDPLGRPVQTVGDLVAFIQAQPRRVAA